MNEGGFTNGLFAYGTRFQLFTALLFVFGLRGEFCIGEVIRDHTKEPLGTVDAVYDLIDRVLIDPKAKDSICLRIVDPDDEPFPSQRQHAENKQSKQWFHLEQQERLRYQFDPENSSSGCRQRQKSDLSESNIIIVITATTASELTAGLGYYFKNYCNFTLEWSTGGRAGGSHIVMPKVWPVPLEHDQKAILRYRTTKWRYVNTGLVADDLFFRIFSLITHISCPVYLSVI